MNKGRKEKIQKSRDKTKNDDWLLHVIIVPFTVVCMRGINFISVYSYQEWTADSSTNNQQPNERKPLLLQFTIT